MSRGCLTAAHVCVSTRHKEIVPAAFPSERDAPSRQIKSKTRKRKTSLLSLKLVQPRHVHPAQSRLAEQATAATSNGTDATTAPYTPFLLYNPIIFSEHPTGLHRHGQEMPSKGNKTRKRNLGRPVAEDGKRLPLPREQDQR